MTPPDRTPAELLDARDRQACQAAGLRKLADLIEGDEDVSLLLSDALRFINAHLPGPDRHEDLRWFHQRADWAGAVVAPLTIGPKFEAVEAAWSSHFVVRLQCRRPEAPVGSAAAEPEIEFGVSA